MPELSEIAKTALSLTAADRAALAHALLTSLDELSVDEASRLWTEEAQRRLSEHRAGRAKSVSAEDIAQKAAGLFR